MDLLQYVLLGLAAVAAGFVDSVVGGGGLIQVPTLFAALPGHLPAEVLGTNKIASVVGTSSAAWQYARRIRPDWSALAWGVGAAALGSWAGARTVSHIDPELFKPIVLVMLVAVAVYTFLRKDFGSVGKPATLSASTAALRTGAIGLCVGCYDGFLGPGTGSFFIFLLIRFLGYDFLSASATAKILNVATNIAAITTFVIMDSVLWQLGLLMAVCNLSGALLGSRMALARGTGFVRKLFLGVVSVLILKMAWDVIARS